MSFILTPDYFLLFVLVGGFLIVIMTAMVYALQCTICLGGSKRRKKLTPSSSSSAEPSQPLGLGQRQLSLSYPGEGGGGVGRPVIGTGFYTSPPVFSVTVPCGTDLVDQSFGQPEWMSGYLFGLHQAGLVQSEENETNEESGHNNQNHGSQNLFYTMNNSDHNMSLNMVDPWATHDSACFIDSDHCYSSSVDDSTSATTSTMDFGDGGAAAASF